MIKCEICQKEFESKRPKRTCSKLCKNVLARRITIQQFEDPAAREVQRQKSLEQKKSPAYQAKVKESMIKRTKRWAEEGHPRTGMLQSIETKQAIGSANSGRFKGKSWEEIFGKEVAARRKIENALSMSSKNEVLLKNRRSKLETKLLPYLPEYRNNVQISYYNVDFINEETKHIIEVYGDYWHCNPNKYADDFMHPYFKMTAVARRKIDEERIAYLESLGYRITIVWESDLNTFIEEL